MRLYVVEDDEGVVAARIISVHKDKASDVYAANSIRSRSKAATYKLMMEAFESLSREGVTKFDFSRIGPGKAGLDSVFMYKRGSGGRLRRYNGDWVFHKTIISDLLITIFRVLSKKTARW